MDTYSVRAARSKTTGHYRRPGTRTLFCGRPAGTPNAQFATLAGWKMCTRCVTAEASDRAEAAAVTETHTPLAIATNAFEQGAYGLLATPTPGPYTLRVCEDSAVLCHRGQCRATSTRAAGTLDDVREAAKTFRHAWAADENGAPVEDEPTTIEDAEALFAVRMVTEAEATAGTWRGAWIGDRPTSDTLFDLDTAAAEQGALFA